MGLLDKESQSTTNITKSCKQMQSSRHLKIMIPRLLSTCILIMIAFLHAVPSVSSCSCQFPKSLRSSFCQSQFAVIVTFDKNALFKDDVRGSFDNQTTASSNAVRTSAKLESRRRLPVRLLKRQLERESTEVRTSDDDPSSLDLKPLKIKDIREVIHMTPKSKAGLSSKILWFRKSKSSCNPIEKLKMNGSTALLVFGDTTSDGRLLLESCKVMQWQFLREDEKSLVRSFVRNGLPCR